MEHKSSQRLDQSIFWGEEDVCAPCASARVKGKRVFLRVVFFLQLFFFSSAFFQIVLIIPFFARSGSLSARVNREKKSYTGKCAGSG